MNVTIDFSQIPTGNPLATAIYVFLNGGWAIFIMVAIWGSLQLFIVRKRLKYYQKWDWVLLSIHIPKNNAQFPKAVEHVFAVLSGAWDRIDWVESYIKGKINPQFSFELISRGGYLEFIVRAPRHLRDLVEAAIYAQYPDAEISEEPDYTEKYKNLSWPDKNGGYDIWGTEFKLQKKHYYPIKTWLQFFGEKETVKDGAFKDPVYAMLEYMAKLRAGEEFWFQVVVTPADKKKWKEQGLVFVRSLLNKEDGGKSVIDFFRNGLMEIADTVIYSIIAKPEVDIKEKDVMGLTAKEQKAVEEIQEKIAKIPFYTKIRAVYIARQEVFNQSKVKEGFRGALYQYTDLFGNGFMEDKYAKVSTNNLHFFAKYRVNHWRKNAIFWNFIERNTRDGSRFGGGFILNTEELASIWHFPIGNVKTLMIKKAEFNKAEAPFTLPMGGEEMEEEVLFDGRISKEGITQRKDEAEPEEVGVEQEEDQEPGPPDDLPIG